jgi:hypothetical protein
LLLLLLLLLLLCSHRKRFYDGDELYRHMESAHEHCFLCRKARPNSFVYYRDYDELDGECEGWCGVRRGGGCAAHRTAGSAAATAAAPDPCLHSPTPRPLTHRPLPVAAPPLPPPGVPGAQVCGVCRGARPQAPLCN